MKNILLLLSIICSSYCFSQNYIVIEHVGVTDRLISLLVTKTGELNAVPIDSNSIYYKLPYVELNLNTDSYNYLNKLIIKNNFVTKNIYNLKFKTFRITIIKGNKRKYLYLQSTKSISFLKYLIESIKKQNFDKELIRRLNEILNSIT